MHKIHALFFNNPTNGNSCTFLTKLPYIGTDNDLYAIEEIRIEHLNEDIKGLEGAFYLGEGETGEDLHAAGVREWAIPALNAVVELKNTSDWPYHRFKKHIKPS